jgi:putative endonuclease
MWVLYILVCGPGGHYYAGVTNDLPLRLHTQLSGKGSKYVRSRLPNVAFLFSVTCISKSEALKLERRIKRLRRDQKEEFMRMEGETWKWLCAQSDEPHMVRSRNKSFGGTT